MFSLYRILLFSLLCAAYTLVFIQNSAITVLAPDIIRDLVLPPDDMGRLSSLYLYAYAIMQFFSGLISSRMGPHRLMGLQFAVAAAGGAMFAASSTLLPAMAGRVMNGLGMAGIMVSSFVLFGRWFSPSMFSRLCTVFFAAGGLGGLLATTPLALLCQIAGWRACCLTLACFSALLSASLFFVVRDFPESSARPEASTSLREHMKKLLGLFKCRALWRLFFLFLALSSPYFVFHGLWGGAYLQTVHGLSPAQSGNVLAMGAVGLIAGAPFITWLSETVLHSHRRTLMLAGLLGSVCFGTLIVFNDALPLWALYAVSLGAGTAANGPTPIAYATARALVGSNAMGTAGGLMASGLFAAGAVLQNVSGALLSLSQVAGLSPAPSFAAAFLPLVLLGLASAALSFTIPETCDKPR